MNKKFMAGGSMLLGSLASIGSAQIASANPNSLTNYGNSTNQYFSNFSLKQDNSESSFVSLDKASNLMNYIKNNLSNSRRLPGGGNFVQYILVNVNKNIQGRDGRCDVYEFTVRAYNRELTVGAKRTSNGDKYCFYTKDYQNSPEEICGAQKIIKMLNGNLLQNTGYSFKLDGNGNIGFFVGNVPIEEIDRERQNAINQYKFNENMFFMSMLRYMQMNNQRNQPINFQQQQNNQNWYRRAHVEGNVYQDANGMSYNFEINQNGQINFIDREFMYDLNSNAFYFKVNNRENRIDWNRRVDPSVVRNLQPLVEILKQQGRFGGKSKIAERAHVEGNVYQDANGMSYHFEINQNDQINFLDRELMYDLNSNAFYFKVNNRENRIDWNRRVNPSVVRNLQPLIEILKQQGRFGSKSKIVENENDFFDFYNERGESELFFVSEDKKLCLISSREGYIYDPATDKFYGNSKYSTGDPYKIDYNLCYGKGSTLGDRAEKRYRILINELKRRGLLPSENRSQSGVRVDTTNSYFKR